MARCPDCLKFVPYGDGDVSDVTVEIDEDCGAVTVNGRVVLPCGECGTELKELSVDENEETIDSFTVDAETLVRDHEDCPVADDASDAVFDAWFVTNVTVKYEFDGEPEPEFHERTQTTYRKKTKKGYVEVPIKSARFMKSYKGVQVAGQVARLITFDGKDGKPVELRDVADFEITCEEPASAFDELT